MTQVRLHLAAMALGIILTVYGLCASAQDWKSEKKVNVLFGLTQLLVAKGFNIEGNYIHTRLIFDYSHGVSLDFAGTSVTAELRRQHLAVHIPWTTGLGMGYRIREWLNLRVEPKWHKFELYYDGEPQNAANKITSYNTFSLGLGLYGAYSPFKHKTNFLSGLLISPSVRFWPTIASTLKDDEFSYFNKHINTMETHQTLDPGIGFTPLVVNISIGYSFSVKRKNNQK
jgi:hypothetical protein